MKFDENSRRKLVRLLGRLGSDNDNERLAAVRLIEAGRKAMDFQWDDVIAKPSVAAGPKKDTMDFNGERASRSRDNSETVCDIFDSLVEFEALLVKADVNSKTEKQRNFVADMRDRFEKYGGDTFLSAAQLSWLRSLARA